MIRLPDGWGAHLAPGTYADGSTIPDAPASDVRPETDADRAHWAQFVPPVVAPVLETRRPAPRTASAYAIALAIAAPRLDAVARSARERITPAARPVPLHCTTGRAPLGRPGAHWALEGKAAGRTM